MKTYHALLIDDNTQNISVLNSLLVKEGIVCTQVTNPTQLPPILEKIGEIDVIFLDLEMPKIDGYAIFEQLRADERFNNTRIIAYTVHVSEMSAVHEMGFDGFLGKPLDADKFPDQLARILNGEPVWERG